MATFSQGFLQSLANPSYARNLYDIGRQVGQAPTAVAQMNKQDQFREIMKLGNAAIANNDAAGLARVASQLNNLGYTEEAVKFSTAARKATKETQAQAKTAAEKEEERKKLASLMGAANMKAAQSSNPGREIALVRGMNREELLKYLSDEKKAEGTRAKPSIETVYNETKKRNELRAVYFDDEGTLKSDFIGLAEEKPEEEEGGFSATEFKEVTRVRGEARGAGLEVIKLNNLLQEAEDLSGYVVGGVVGDLRDFVVSDVAGLGDAVTAFRTRLNETQMKNAIALLPRGPASDRDVQLALNASQDLKDYSTEQRLSALRGMVKIAEAAQQYTEGQLEWIEQTGDASALGYDRYASVIGLDKQIATAKSDFSSGVKAIDDILTEAAFLEQQGNTSEAQAMVQVARQTQDSLRKSGVINIDYLNLLEQRADQANKYNRFIKQNKITNYLEL